jgi:signal transduction histidine kinase
VAQDLPNKRLVTPETDSSLAERLEALERSVAQRERELAILADVSIRHHRQEDVDAILDSTLEELLAGLGLRSAWVLLWDEAGGRLRLAAHRGLSSEYLALVERKGLGECLCREVFASGRGGQARNTLECPRMPMIGEGLQQPAAHACVPLAFKGASRGVLNVAALPGATFDADELRFLETVGRQLCLAVEGAQHLKAERIYNQEARALAALNKGIGQSLDPEAVLEAVGQTALGVVRVDRVHILLGSDPRELVVGHVAGLPHPELRKGQPVDLTAVGDSIHRRALEQQVRLMVSDFDLDAGVNKELARRWAGASALVLPLVARKATLGLLVLTCERPHAWSEDQIDVAEALASQASVALENARLYDKARRAYRELNDAQARIIQAEKLAVVGTFASGLAHEVRNPLNSIALQLSVLERRVAPLPATVAAQMKQLVNVIREEVKRLDNLVGDFLQFSRSNRVQYRPTSLDALVDEVARLLRPEAKAAGVSLLRERIGEPMPDVRVDPEKMKQVVINLVQNAIEAMPDGGRVEIASGLVDGRAQLVVQDTGPGLPEGLDVFQLFVTTKARGTGLGLSIAQQIVLEHGGEIVAASEPGEGARFTVSLKVERPELAAGDEA